MSSDPHTAASYLALRLEGLMALPLETPADLVHWDAEADKVEQTLKEQFPNFEPWEECRHFMADADIRARDGGYRNYQHRLISDYITRLRNEK